MIGFAPPGDYTPADLPSAFAAVQGLDLYRFASAVYATTSDDDPADTHYPARLIGDVEIGQSAFDALGIGGRVALGVADIDLWHYDRGLADPARYGTSDGRAVAIRTIEVTDPQASCFGQALGAATLAWSGIVRTISETEAMRLRLSVVDVAEKLATPLQTNRYTGGGGLEGPDSLRDRPKPVAMGHAYNVLPVALGNIDLGDGALPTYQTNWRAVQAHTAVRIRGVAQTSTGSAPTVGQYRDWPDDGVFQIGSTPDGVVTADVEGDCTPVFVNSTAGVIRRLVQALGPALADSEISSDSFAFADTDLPGVIGWYRGAVEVTCAAAVEEILAGSGAILAGGRGGTLRLFDPMVTAETQFALTDGDLISLAPVPLPATLRPIPFAVTVGWQRNWNPLTDLAGSVTDEDRAALTEQASGPARSQSETLSARIAQHRELRFPAIYTDETAALERAAIWLAWLESGPRAFTATTDRYLGQIEGGDVGMLTYPAYGLDAGVRVAVVGWREALAARRLTLTLITLPEI